MARRGMFYPGLPHRNIAQVAALRSWGYGLDGAAARGGGTQSWQVAVIDEAQGEISYAGLLARSVKVAGALRAMGLGPGDAVGLLARNHVDAVAVIAGAAMLGLDLVLLNVGLSGPAVAQMVEREGLRLVVHDEDLASAVANLAPTVAQVSESELAAQARASPQADPLQPPRRRGRTVMLTSGTTGAPRGRPARIRMARQP